MMKLITLTLALVLTAGLALAQPIGDIQYYNPDTGAPESPYDGQTVTVTGTVYVPAGPYNGGTHYIQGATGGISMFQSGTGLQIGDEVEITGTVSVYLGEIQIANGFSWDVLSSGNPRPTPIPSTPAEIMSTYEWVGNFVAVTGIVTAVTGNSNFMLATGGAEDLMVYIDSTTQINLGAVNVGDEYMVLSPVVVYNGLIELKPAYQTDLIEDPSGDTLPIITNVRCDNYVPLTSTPVEVSAAIVDNNAVAGATVYYRDSDGETPGAWNALPMSNTGGDTWAATIPAGHAGSQIDYYLDATDDGDQTVTMPGDAPASWFEVAVGITSIYEMQWVHPDSTNQDSPYVDKVLNIRGVVTAGTSEAGASSRFVVQEQEEGPFDGYGWGGVLVYESSATYEYYRGDLVEIGGYGGNYFGLDEMEPHNGDAVNLLAFGAELPTAARVHTRILADNTLDDGNGILGGAWESVWVKSMSSMVMDTLGYGEYIISDTAARADSVEVDPSVDLTYQPTIGDVVFVEGFMDFAFGAFQITPIGDEFVTLTTMVAVDDTPTVEAAGGFTAVYPNPFNPATKLEFVLTRDNLTQLNIYNLRGELVRSLVNETLPSGSYQLTWDGRNAEGQTMASGQYFARLRIGKSVMQVRKLSLVK